MRETWYVLEDGSVADPRECSPDKNGRLAHKSGALVEMREETPRSRGVDPDEERAKAKSVKAKEGPEYETRDLTAEKSKRGYKTRKG